VTVGIYEGTAHITLDQIGNKVSGNAVTETKFGVWLESRCVTGKTWDDPYVNFNKVTGNKLIDLLVTGDTGVKVNLDSSQCGGTYTPYAQNNTLIPNTILGFTNLVVVPPSLGPAPAPAGGPGARRPQYDTPLPENMRR
jgi:hypothetical protein